MKRSFKKFVTRLETSGLFGRVEARAINMHVSLQDLYEGPYSTSVVAARRSVYSWLIQEGKTVNEVAVLFDRSASGVAKLMREVAR